MCVFARISLFLRRRHRCFSFCACSFLCEYARTYTHTHFSFSWRTILAAAATTTTTASEIRRKNNLLSMPMIPPRNFYVLRNARVLQEHTQMISFSIFSFCCLLLLVALSSTKPPHTHTHRKFEKNQSNKRYHISVNVFEACYALYSQQQFIPTTQFFFIRLRCIQLLKYSVALLMLGASQLCIYDGE